MSKLAALVSAAIVICISCGVAWDLAWTYGMGVQGFSRFLTFSDYLNMSVKVGGVLGPAVFLFGLLYLVISPSLLEWLTSDQANKIQDDDIVENDSASTWTKYVNRCWKIFYRIVLMLGTVWAVAFILIVLTFIYWWLVVLVVIGLVLTLRARQIFPRTSVAFGTLFSLLLLTVVAGGYSGGVDTRTALTSGDLRSLHLWHVVTRNREMKGVFISQIDRGVVVFEKASFRLIPWNEVLLVEAQNDKPDQNGDVFWIEKMILSKARCYASGIYSATRGRQPWPAIGICGTNITQSERDGKKR